VFLAINILLFAVNFIKSTTSYFLSSDRLEDIARILEDREITVDVDLPRVFTPKLQASMIIPENTSERREEVVRALLGSLDQAAISTQNNQSGLQEVSRTYTLNNISITFNRDDILYSNDNLAKDERPDHLRAAKDSCKKFIAAMGLSETLKNPYIKVIEDEEAMTLTYYTKFEGIPVFDSFIAFTVKDTGVAKAAVHVAKVEPLKATSVKKNIYPIDMVLFGIEDYFESQQPIRITDIVLGYCSLDTDGMDILEEEIVPAYKITIDGLEEPLFVNAYTNKEIKIKLFI
jgi:hypothetical protein